MFLYQHAGLPDITTTIRQLGARIGNIKESNALADRIEAEIADVRKRVAGRPRPRTLLVFGRDAETLRGIYASGAIGFLHDMLEAAGGRTSLPTSSARAFRRRASLRLRARPTSSSKLASTPRARAAAISARGNRCRRFRPCGTRRIYQLRGDGMMNPGPRISASVRRVAEVLHPEAFESGK